VRPAGQSPSQQLFAQAARFRFDAALRVLMRRAGTSEPSDAASFRTPPGFAYPAAEVAEIQLGSDGALPLVTTPVIGLTGAGGVLPRFYTEMITATLRSRSRAMHEFLDMLGQRFVGSFVSAGIKYRLSRAAETAAMATPPALAPASEALLAFTGYATPHLVGRLAVGTEPLLHYAGLFASRPRSAEKLEALVSDWLGRRVEIMQFAGAWLPLPPDQRSGLARGRHSGQWNRLGVDAAIGVRTWDPQARIVLRIGPLDRTTFQSLLPDRTGLQRLVSLVRAFVGFEIGFAVNPVLAGPEIPPLRLDGNGARLGWDSWIPNPEPPLPGIPRRDGVEALFEAEIIEAQAPQRRLEPRPVA
jgi:type VI secretion system protein ImpH